jgi:hypothetical protein
MPTPNKLFPKGARVITLLAALLLLSECRKELPEPEGSGVEPVPTASSSETSAPALHLPPAALGEWVGSKRYRLRVVGVSPCDEGSAANGVLPSTDARREAGGFRLGVEVEVEANEANTVSPVFVSAKAATLAKDGKLFQALLEPTATPACAALLDPKRLAPGESIRGILVFEAPDVTYLRSAVLQFRPARWGGELRVEVRLPELEPALRVAPPPRGEGRGDPS